MKISKLNEFVLLREQSGLTIDEIAEATGSTIRTVYRWEKGESKANKLVLNLLKEKAYEYKPQSRSSSKFSFIDLFAGIGGMRIAFEKMGGECIYTSEWDSHAVKTYLANFPLTHKIDGDINLVHPEDIPKHDILLAGFPCQPFSIAGVSKKNALGKPHGFRDKTQGTLFFKIAELLNYHKPKAFLLENVKNLKNHDKGNTYKIITETLLELGYKFDSIIIDAKAYVPQHRERIFIAGFRDENNFSFDKLKLPSVAMGPKLRDILHPEDGSQFPEPPYTYGDKALVNEKYILTPHLWNYLRSYAERHREKGNGFGFGLVEANQTARTLSARYYKDGSEILIKRGKKLPRRLTPRECSRLMGFDSKDRVFKIPVSDTQAYKQFGNAVVVPVVETVAKYILPFLLRNSN